MLTKWESPKTIKKIFRSKWNCSAFNVYKNESDILKFLNPKDSLSLHSHYHDDDFDTDEEEIKRGINKSIMNLVEGFRLNVPKKWKVTVTTSTIWKFDFNWKRMLSET